MPLFFKNKSKACCLRWNHPAQLLYHLDTAIAVVFLIRESKRVIVCVGLSQSNHIAYAILYANPCSLYIFLYTDHRVIKI
jgi:hypothetical protein